MKGVIRVLWNCDMGKNCTNEERPGVHEEHRDMERCRGQHAEVLLPEPAPIPSKQIRDRQ